MYNKFIEYLKVCRALILLLSVAGTLQAGTTGKLAGRVTIKGSGEPMIGANVLINDTDLGTATDAEGNYYILQVSPGKYTVRFTMIGYQDLIMKDVRIQVDLTTTINTELSESVIGMSEVVVQAERPMINTGVTYSQANISSEEVEMLPVEEFEDVIALQAGVVNSNGEIHVRGGRGGEIAYMVDGITVTDPFNSGISVEIENNAIQELQFISGTFNAEYGQAMSAIVNIVTKDGSYSKYMGSVSYNAGSYVSNDGNLFPQIGNFNLNGISDIKGNIEGPILPKKLSFFASGRFKRNNGYLYGQRIFHPNTFAWDPEGNNFIVDEEVGLGNGNVPGFDQDIPTFIDSLREADVFDWVSMNWNEQVTAQVKFSWRVTSRMKMAYNRMYSDNKSQDYSHLYKWNPDGRSNYFNTRIGNLFRMDLSLSRSTFANIMLSQSTNHYRNHLSDDPEFYKELDFEFSDEEGWFSDRPQLDSNVYYVNPTIYDYTPVNNYYSGGQSMGAYNRKSIVNTFKAELTSQLNAGHQFKTGFEYRVTNITLTDITIQLSDYTDNNPTYQNPLYSPTNDSYGKDGRNPREMSFYVQDKMEADNIVANFGLRYDYFDPQWKTVNDLRDPNHRVPLKPINQYFDLDGDGEISEDEMYNGNRKTDEDRLLSNEYGDPWYENVDPKTQISPRFALAFPITDKGYLHFSYGHFFQNPGFSFLYTNPEFEVPPSSGVGTTMGNANMKPQRTTQYEVGFSQQFGQDLGIEVTGYFKDIRNLNSTKIVQSFVAGDRYGLYINKDYANSRGITVAVSKRARGPFSGNIDYTYSISEGNASDPAAAFYDEQANIEPEKVLVPLDWDQRHTLNATMTYHPIKNSGISVVASYGSGLPYTTEYIGVRTSFENNAREPATYNLDMRSYYNFILLNKFQISAHINIYNLFDTQNELTVYNDTGRSTYTLLPTYTPQISGPGFNTLDEYLVRPDFYSSPRQVKIGFSVSMK
tara:strand:- start:1211 stop:4156 length:2946 start_codon:yes stop_codon:yes gene_type:complete